MDSDKIKNVLLDLGYKLKDNGSYWQSSALYRNGDNPTALQIYKNSGAWKDYVKGTNFLSFKQLLILTLNTNDPKELEKYLSKDESFFLAGNFSKSNEKLETENIFPNHAIDRLLPHYQFYNKKGICDQILKKLSSGYATSGPMNCRYVFPIFNHNYFIHGFSGRIMITKSSAPKWKHVGKKSNWIYPGYVKYKGDEVFNKSNEDYVIVVESIGDCLSLMQNGYDNVLVSFGLDMSSKLISFIISKQFKKVILSLNNDSSSNENRGQNACVKNFLKLLTFFDSKNIKICLPTQNDFGDMTSLDFKTWEKKLISIQKIDQIPKVSSLANKMRKKKLLTKSLIKNLELISE